MKVELASEEFDPLIRQIVQECLQQLELRHKHHNQAPGQTFDAAPANLLLNSSQAAKMLGISERTLWELKRAGELPYVPIGNGSRKESIRYAVDDLYKLIEKRKTCGKENGTITKP